MKTLLFTMMSILLLANIQKLVFGRIRPMDGIRSFYENSRDLKSRVSREDLPDPVRKSLDEAVFEGWKITSLHEIKNGEGVEAMLKMGNSIRIIEFDKDGNADQNHEYPLSYFDF